MCLAVLSCVRVRALVTKHRFVQGVMKVCASREKSEIVCVCPVCVLCVCVCVFMWDESAADVSMYEAARALASKGQ